VFTLSNGAKIISLHYSSDHRYPDGAISGVVLAQFHDDLVTWAVTSTTEDPNTLDAYWGHYFRTTDRAEAERDYSERVARGY
jgi:hypothetical protein